jgi:hypothetical protein
MPIKTSTSSSASRRILVILALTLFIVALVLVIVSSVMPGSSKKGVLSLGGSYAEGYKAAREQAYALGVQKLPMTSLTGTIESVSGDTIKIKTNLFVDQRVDGVGPERTIKSDGSTKIVKQSPKDSAAIQKEQEAFIASMKDLKPGDKTVTPPSMFDEKEIKISDLKTGDMITVTGNGKDDLTLIDPVQASKIQTQSALVPAAAVTAPIVAPAK